MTEKSGHEKVTAIKNSDIVAARDARKDKPSDANKFLKASRKIFDYAHRRNLININPALGIPKIKEKLSGEGFHTWTEEECLKFEKFWPVGTRQRLAYDIFRFTGLRRGGAVRLGKQHVKDGEFTIKNQKTGREVTSTILPPLLTSIAATTTGDLTFLVTVKGRPFDKWTFGNWFRAACVKAQVPGSAHGIRKASASAVAEGGATEAEMNSLFGWAHGSRESATYIEKASRKRMAKKASKLLFSRTSELGKGEIDVKRLKLKDKE